MRTHRHKCLWNAALSFAAALCLCALLSFDCAAQDTKPDTPPTPPTQPEQQPPQPPAQSPPDSPGAAKPPDANPPADSGSHDNDNPNPIQQIGDATKQAAVMTKDAATAGILKARDWESGAISGIYIGRNRQRVTLTTQQREEIYLRQTFTTPSAYIKRMFAAGFDQARGVPSQWDGGFKGYGERFASREGQFITANSLAALGNAALGYEVRYDQCKCTGLWHRTRHALLRNLMTYDRSEEHLRPQLALYAGAFGGGLVSTAWKPHPRNAFAEGGRAMGGQLAWGTILNFITEFSREINRKQGVKR